MSRLAKGIAGSNEVRVEPVTRKILTRRDVLRAGAAGAAGLAVSGLGGAPTVRAAEPTMQFPGMGQPEDGMTYDSGPSSRIHRPEEPNRFDRLGVSNGIDRSRRDSVALSQQQYMKEKKYRDKHLGPNGGMERGKHQGRHKGGIQPYDLGNIDNVLWGTGLYIGNEFLNWSDSTRANVFAQIANWGFYFASPKVGGYGSTWYGSAAQLNSWRDMCWNNGIGFAPFIYSVPNSYYRDAQISSDLVNNGGGIAIVDMEDEWAYYYNTMTQFGQVFRSYNPYDPICVTGYGDPITRFGNGVFPCQQLAAWADGYMPQWYYGVWDIYHRSGVQAAINWADNECGQSFGYSYPLCPNMSIYTNTGNGILPYGDISAGEEYAWNWQAPIIWWEYSNMNDTIAYYCQN